MENSVEVLELPLVPRESLSFFAPAIYQMYGNKFDLNNYLESKVVLGKNCKLNLGLYDKNGILQYLFVDYNFEVTSETLVDIYHPYSQFNQESSPTLIGIIINKDELKFLEDIEKDVPISITDLKNNYTRQLANLLNRYDSGWTISPGNKTVEGFKVNFIGDADLLTIVFPAMSNLSYCVLLSLKINGIYKKFILGI